MSGGNPARLDAGSILLHDILIRTRTSTGMIQMDRPSVTASLSRRDLLAAATAAVGVAALAPMAAADDVAGASETKPSGGRLKQSVCKWCYGNMPLDHLCAAAKKMGLVGIDLLGPDEFKTVKKHGLICTMTTSHPLDKGLCDPQYHDMALAKMRAAIEATAAEGWRNVICFSGNARGIDRETGLKNCAAALRQITPFAEEKNVILNMELLNSRVDHPDYMCDRSDWGVKLCKEVGSDHFKLLYDIYHMQIMEGDIIRTIKRDHQYFGHYHTAGNPGRHELDDRQELFYPPIAAAVAELDFDGYFVHEFIPTGDPLAGLQAAVTLCDV